MSVIAPRTDGPDCSGKSMLTLTTVFAIVSRTASPRSASGMRRVSRIRVMTLLRGVRLVLVRSGP